MARLAQGTLQTLHLGVGILLRLQGKLIVARGTIKLTLGVLDLGRVPRGSDERAEAIAADLRASGFASRVDGEIMRWKYGKLLSNLANAVEALLGPDARGGELVRRAREEALACYRAAGIGYAGPEEIASRAADHHWSIGTISGYATVQSRRRRSPALPGRSRGDALR